VELGEETAEAKGRLDLQADQNLAVEGRGRHGGVGEIDDAIDIAVEGVGEGAKGGGFAGADVTGDEGREALLKSEGEAALDLLVAARGVEVLSGDRLGERGLVEAVDVIESDHRMSPPLSWMD
jgi:hypothetical protein